MARKIIATQDGSVRISAKWQAALVVAILCGFLSNVVLITLSFTRNNIYISLGTWVYQLSTWLYPMILFAIGLWYVKSHYILWLPRIFLATILTIIGIVAFDSVSSLSNMIHSNYFGIYGGTGWWNAFGLYWTLMVASIIIYSSILFRTNIRPKSGVKK